MLEHRPHHANQVVSRRHHGDLSSLGIFALDSIFESTNRRRTTNALPNRLGQQVSNGRRAFPGNVPQPIGISRLILTGDQSEICADPFAMVETMRIVEERDHRFGRANPDSGNRSQQLNGHAVLGIAGKFLFDSFDLVVVRLDLGNEQVAIQSMHRIVQNQ